MRTNDRLLIAGLVAASLLPYLNAVGNGFAFDDRGMILQNPLVLAADTPLVRFFSEPFHPGALYRPLAFYSYWLNQRLFGLAPAAYHAVNLGLHAIVTVLLYALGRSLHLGKTAAALAALFFAVHPIHTEAVTNVIGRSELMCAASVLGALLCIARSRAADATPAVRVAGRVGAAALFVVGLLSKESAFVLLPLMVVTTWIVEKRTLGQTTASLLRSGDLPLQASIGVAYLVLRWHLFGTLTVGDPVAWLDNPLAHSPLAVRLATAAVVLADSIVQILLPLRLSADYSFNQVPLVESAQDPRLPLALLLLALGALLLSRHREFAGGGLFFLGAVSLTANLLFPIGTIRAERLLYLPSAGFCIMAGLAGARMLRERPRSAEVALALLVIACAGRAWARNPDWASDLTLFSATVATSPESAKAHHNLGAALAEELRPQDAAFAFRQALQIHPEYEESAFSIGRMYEVRGMMYGALHWYDEALRIDPAHLKSNLNRGVILYNRGEIEAAEAAFRAGLEHHPGEPRLLMGMGFVRLAEGRVDEARDLLEEVRRVAPPDSETRRALELALEHTAGVMKGS